MKSPYHKVYPNLWVLNHRSYIHAFPSMAPPSSTHLAVLSRLPALTPGLSHVDPFHGIWGFNVWDNSRKLLRLSQTWQWNIQKIISRWFCQLETSINTGFILADFRPANRVSFPEGHPFLLFHPARAFHVAENFIILLQLLFTSLQLLKTWAFSTSRNMRNPIRKFSKE